MPARLFRIFLWACLPALLAGCAHWGARRTPLTPGLVQALFGGAGDLGAIQVFYQARGETVFGSERTRPTVFRHTRQEVKTSVTLTPRPTLEKATTRVKDEIILRNRTPGVIAGAKRTRAGGFLLDVDFGGNIILQFESHTEDAPFYLKTREIRDRELTYVRDKACFGFLSVDLRRIGHRAEDSRRREIPGKHTSPAD